MYNMRNKVYIMYRPKYKDLGIQKFNTKEV